VIQKAVLLSPGRAIRLEDVDFPSAKLFGSTDGQPGTTLRSARLRAERDIISQTLARTAGNISMTAKILDIDRKWLMRKMGELGVDVAAFRR
jgi:DNA-binding NtrC family response regulator